VSSRKVFTCFGLWLPWLPGVDNIDFFRAKLDYVRSSPLVTKVALAVFDEMGNDVCDLGEYEVTSDEMKITGSCSVRSVTATVFRPVLADSAMNGLIKRSPCSGYVIAFALGQPGTSLDLKINGSEVASRTLIDLEGDGTGNAAVVASVEEGDLVEAASQGNTVVLMFVDVELLRTLTIYVMEQPISTQYQATSAQIFACYAYSLPPQASNSYEIEVLTGG